MPQSDKIVLLVLCLLAAQQVRSQLQNCVNPNYIIPYQELNSAFDAGIDSIRGQEELTTLIQNPTSENAKSYLLSLAPFSVPLIAMAVVTLLILIATIIQVICFNSCSKECCGNPITSQTYNLCCLRTMVAVFLISCFLVMSLSIAALILNSDLQKAIDYTQCNTQDIVYEGFYGNNNSTIQWSGLISFLTNINKFGNTIQNNIPFLASYFSAGNPAYSEITSGPSYTNSQVFACSNANNATNPISCPFPSASTCPAAYTAQFNTQFCNANFPGSANNLISRQMQVNSTTWKNSTQQISLTITGMNLSSSSVNDLVTSVSEFSSSFSLYEVAIESGFNQLDIVQGGISIAFYTFYSITLALSLLAIVSVCMSYFCNMFKCRYFLYILWYLFAILAILLFIDSGIFLGGSVAFQDACLAYPYFFKNVTNFNKLAFGNQSAQAGNIFSTCFFPPNGKYPSIFVAFPNNPIVAQFSVLNNQYRMAVPASSFSSVVTQIENQLINYAANPNTVIIDNVAASLQPQVALDQANLFANYSLPNSNQGCTATKDYLTFDVVNCGKYLTNQPAGQNSCVVISDPNINNIMTKRVDAFTNKNCSTGATYYSNIRALEDYGISISNIVEILAPIQQQTPPTPMQAYQNSYFGYYSNVMNFYNAQIQQTFNGFIQPYNQLIAGSSCGFVTSSMDGIVNIACNQLQPFMTGFAAINIVESVFLLIIFMLTYFLTTRLQFYEYLEGNFNNFGMDTSKGMGDMTLDSKNIELLETNKSQM